MSIIFGSLFAGIGGFDLGLERAGMQCAWQVEIDPFCQKVLAKHWPDVARYEDVRQVHGVMAHAESTGWGQDGPKKLIGLLERGQSSLEGTSCPACLPPVDLICGGFPCQPHSHAGKRKGAADDRDLWPEYRRIIAELRPRWVIGENVPGIVTTILDQVLSDLESMGYSWQAFVIPAVAFDAPHRRDRVWIVAHTGRLSNESQRADRNIVGAQGRISGEVGQQWLWAAAANGSKAMADAHPRGFQEQWQSVPLQEGQAWDKAERISSLDAHANGERQQEQRRASTSGKECTEPEFGDWWSAEPDVGRVAYGVSSRVDRLRALGNAVVPQVVEFLGRLIIEVDSKYNIQE